MTCDYVYLCLKGQPSKRSLLSQRVRQALAAGRFVHWVDPCVLPRHKASTPHMLSTMRRP